MTNEIILTIKDKIHTIRGMQVMLDRDIAELYEVETKVLNQAVKRNIDRFPERFMFQLSNKELEELRSHYENKKNWKSQFVTSNIKMSLRKKPYAFTEQGVAMLSGVLKSNEAIIVSIQIIDAFVAMRKFITSNSQIFQKINNVERNQLEYEIKTDMKFEEVFKAIEDKDIKPEKGIFFDGQVYDAYSFVSNLIRNAKEEIILIDNYIDDTVLTLFSKRTKNVNIKIYTKNITKELKLDLEKYNTQYEKIKIIKFDKSHDRFLIIDNKEVYHFGASLKDLGKKWFGFSKFDKETMKIIDKLNKY